jgi:hypothetical protein
MAVERAQIDGAAGPAAGAKDVEPWRACEQRGPDRGRPKHIAPGGEAPIPSVDYGLGFLARGAVRLQVGGASLDVQTSCPDAHRGSIDAPAGEVDPAYAFFRAD